MPLETLGPIGPRAIGERVNRDMVSGPQKVLVGFIRGVLRGLHVLNRSEYSFFTSTVPREKAWVARVKGHAFLA
jgi:hypothetical protein